MPHIIVEHTNIKVDMRQLLLAINQSLVKAFPEEFPVPVAIKSRAINVGEDYCVGIDLEEQSTLAFIHCNVRILSNRPLEVRTGIAAAAKTAMEAFLTEYYKKEGKHTQITAECGELVRETFQKVVFDARESQ